MPSLSQHLISRARIALRMSQREIGLLVGASTRTAHRWEGGKTSPDSPALRKIAIALAPIDPGLAEELAAHTGTTLVALCPPPPPPPESAPPVRPFPSVVLLVDSIVAAATDAGEQGGAPPITASTLRTILGGAFGRAKALGLSVDEVDAVLAGAAAARAASAKR